MADEDKKKSIFSNLVDALTNRDEKEAAEKAAAEAAAAAELAAKEAEARKEAAEEKRAELAAKVAAEKEAKEKAAKEAAEKAKQEAAARARIEENRRKLEEEAKKRAEEARKRAEEAAKPKFIAEHKVSPDETLSHLALKYYGHATPQYYMLIYEANKETIGGNPNIIRVGTVLNIPELPEELKK